MRIITALFVGLAALTAISTTAAEAKGGCGSGMFFDGQRCVPMGGPGYRHEPGHRGAYLMHRTTGTTGITIGRTTGTTIGRTTEVLAAACIWVLGRACTFI
jgi:hypothetical protein